MTLHSDITKNPLERAIELIDLVTKTRGADHLKVASRHLNLIQYFCLDVIAFFAFVFYCVWKLPQVWWRMFKERRRLQKKIKSD